MKYHYFFMAAVLAASIAVGDKTAIVVMTLAFFVERLGAAAMWFYEQYEDQPVRKVFAVLAGIFFVGMMVCLAIALYLIVVGAM